MHIAKCPSVRMSVAIRYRVKTAKLIVEILFTSWWNSEI